MTVHRTGNAGEQTVTATVKYPNINKGSPTSAKVKKEIDEIKAPKDQRGHIVARVLGGPGDNVDNFTPMNSTLNQGEFMGFERKIKNAIMKNRGWEAHLRIVLTFNPEALDYPKRPTWIHYYCEFFEGGTFKEKLEKNFENELSGVSDS